MEYYCPFALSLHALHFLAGVGNFLAVRWLGLRASTAGGMGSITGRGTKIPHAAWCGQKEKKKKKKAGVNCLAGIFGGGIEYV